MSAVKPTAEDYERAMEQMVEQEEWCPSEVRLLKDRAASIASEPKFLKAAYLVVGQGRALYSYAIACQSREEIQAAVKKIESVNKYASVFVLGDPNSSDAECRHCFGSKKDTSYVGPGPVPPCPECSAPTPNC